VSELGSPAAAFIDYDSHTAATLTCAPQEIKREVLDLAQNLRETSEL
jgi:hypothetical protein